MLERDREIDAALANVVGISLDALNRKDGSKPFSERRFSVRNILLVSSAYDYFLLEEEGRLSDLFKKIYVQRDLGYIPTIKHVATGLAALKVLEGDWIDLLVIFNPPSDMSFFELASDAKKKRPELPIIYMANNTPELDRTAEMEGAKDIDDIFTWHGDGEVFLGMVQLIEDSRNAPMNLQSGANVLLLVDSDIASYSKLVPLIYREIWMHLETVLGDDLTNAQRLSKIQMMPGLILAKDDLEARKALLSTKDKLLCIIANANDLAGFGAEERKGTFVELWMGTDNRPPLLVVDGDGSGWEGSGARLTRRNSPELLPEMREFIAHNLGNEDMAFIEPDGRISAVVKDISSLERALYSVSDAALLKNAKEGAVRSWLAGRLEIELANRFERAIGLSGDAQELRRSLIDLLHHHRQEVHHGSVANYSRKSYGSHVRFSRIGTGPMGGKARGLAFMDKILATYVRSDLFPGVEICIPRTLVLCTDIFERFMKENKSLTNGSHSQPDERIAAAFQQGNLPMTVLGDLRAFIEEVRVPLIVRSSSLLEDTFFQPFAGVYSSVMLPNSSLEPDIRYQELCSSIKFVYASTYFQKARTYIRSTPNRIEDEKMGVVIQQVIGKRHGSAFYPDVSGVARSYDYWPSSRCANTDGTASLALGLGKTIVDGGTAFRFCPLHPNVSNFGSVGDMLKQTQTRFYAINLESRKRLLEEDDTLVQLHLETAEKDGALSFAASTYSVESDRLIPGIGWDGPRVIDFAPLLRSDKVPLPKIVQLMLRLGEISLGCPVEIEFAMNLDPENGVPSEFAFLQVRSMVARSGIVQVNIEDYSRKAVLCRTDRAMGNDIISDISDIIFIDPIDFDMRSSQDAVQFLRRLNAELMDKGKKYLLIGPGRWGSKDPCLGIPVAWSDIAGAKVIVETPMADRTIDPSQGSHFFQNMSSLRLGYFTMKPEFASSIDWEWLRRLPGKVRLGSATHVTLKDPIEVRIDGRTGQGVILKRSSKNDKA